MNWILLVLLAQLAWAGGNFIDRYLLERYRKEKDSGTAVGALVIFSAGFTLLVAFVVFILANILPQLGYSGEISLQLNKTALLLALLLGTLEILWLIPYLYALNNSDEAECTPLFQTVPIFGLILGGLFFNEVPTAFHLLGVAVILAGAIILSVEITPTWRQLKPKFSMLMPMLLASAIISLSAFIFKLSAIEEGYLAVAFWMSLGAFTTGCCLWAFVPTYRRDFNTFVERKNFFDLGLNFTNEIIDNVAILAFYAAVLLGPSTAVVQASIAYQPLFILLFAFIAVKLGSKFHVAKLSGGELWRKSSAILFIVAGSIIVNL